MSCKKTLRLEGGRLRNVGTESFRHGFAVPPPFDKGGSPLSHGWCRASSPTGGAEAVPKVCHCEEAQRADVAIRNPRPLAPL